MCESRGAEMNERWAFVPGMNVQVSCQGRIRFKKKYGWSKPKIPVPDIRGYCRFQHHGKHVSMHNAVWLAFNGQIPPDKTVDHIAKYGDMMKERSDNRLCNLRLETSEGQRSNQRKSTLRRDARSILVWKIGSEHRFEFTSAHEAASSLGLDARCLRSVAKGEARQTKGYLASFKTHGVDLLHEDEEFRNVQGRSVSQYGRMLDPRTKAFAVTPITTEGNDYAATEHPISGKKILFHHLVAQAFPELVEGTRVDGSTLDHIDRNKDNNCASNLAWKSVTEQALNRQYKDDSRFDTRLYSIDVIIPGEGRVPCESMADASRMAKLRGHDVSDIAISRGVKRSGVYVVTKGGAKGWRFEQVCRKGVD